MTVLPASVLPHRKNNKNLRIDTGFAVALGLLTALGVEAAPIPPDAGQTIRELQKQPDLGPPKTTAPLQIEGESKTQETSGNDIRIAVKAIRITGSSVFPADELDAMLVDLVGNERSLAELDAGAARITAQYRAHGYVLARAYLPAQDIVDGIVTINVLEGLVGRRNINNRSRLADERANAYFSEVKSGEALQTKPVDRALLLLNDTPGVGGTRASLQPGASVGTSDLLVEIDPARPYVANAELDNYGNRYTGEHRLSGALALNSPFKIGDQFTLRILKSELDMTYARLAYAIPLGGSGLRAGIAYSDTSYTLGKEYSALRSHGSATSSSLYATYPFVRSQATNLSGTLTWESKKLIDWIGAPLSVIDKRVQLINLGLTGNHHDAWGGGALNSFDVSLAAGRLNMDTTSLAADVASARSNGAFKRLSYNFSRLQYLSDADTLSMALSGQQAGKNLNSSEKFSTGGVNGVRAYPQGEGNGDAGWLTNIELRHGFTTSLQGVLFYDAGKVTINRHPYIVGASNSRFISGIGLGINAALGGVQIKASMAWRSSGGQPSAEPATLNRNPRLWLQAGSSF